jgi:hypothetical protein
MQPSDIFVAGLRDPVCLLLIAAGFARSMLGRGWHSCRFDHPERVERSRSHWLGRLVGAALAEPANSSPLDCSLSPSSSTWYPAIAAAPAAP